MMMMMMMMMNTMKMMMKTRERERGKAQTIISELPTIGISIISINTQQLLPEEIRVKIVHVNRREKVAYSDRQPTIKSLTITAHITILEDTQIKIIQPELTQRSK